MVTNHFTEPGRAYYHAVRITHMNMQVVIRLLATLALVGAAIVLAISLQSLAKATRSLTTMDRLHSVVKS